MPKRGSVRGNARWASHPHQSRGGRSGGRGGRGAQGGGRSSGFKRKRHSDEAGDGFIPLTGRQSEYYRHLQISKRLSGKQIGEYYRQLQISKRQSEGGSGSRGKSRRGRHRPTEVRFNKAVHTGPLKDTKSKESSDGEYDGSDQGLDSDEISESEEEFLMQEFEWIEDDQDPDRKSKTATSTALQPPSEPIIPITGWGGALAYHSSSQSNVDLRDITKGDSNSRIHCGMDWQLTTDDTQATTGILKNTKYLDNYTAPTPSPLDHRHKKLKADAELSNDIQARLRIEDVSIKDIQHRPPPTNFSKEPATDIEHEPLLWVMDTEPDSIAADYVRDTIPIANLAEQVEVVTTKSSARFTEETQLFSTPPKHGKSEKAGEHNAPLWVMDTVGEATKVEEVQETYIDLPSHETGLLGRKRKKANRSKRGGRKLREKERERIKQMADDGGIMLEENTSDEIDDEELALQDYLQNTMDSDDENGAGSLMGLLQGTLSGFGHSNDIGGMDPDDSDFDEDTSQVDSHDDEDFDFTSKHRERRRRQRMDDDLSRAVDGALSPSWPSGMPQGYETFLDNVAQSLEGASDTGMQGRSWRRRRGEPHGGSVETLSEINRMIEKFVREGRTQSLQLPPMMTALRRRVHLLSTLYGLRSESVGSGKHRFAVLLRTDSARLPKNPDEVQKILTQSDKEVKERTVEFQMHSRGHKGSRRHREDGGSKRPPAATITNGAVVGATAAPISTENVGHRLLSKMGWTPGVGLGASGSGITKPIEAVMKRTRSGVGHDKDIK
ncbi:hypothetical protein BGX21_003353 [Mortierella sp. AD011]|nr:hypothetical protein BGX20_003325 [Mortierella sp. AD010]KAF9376926.1 hypothetical protein BGX21_003353 [Mortierella sp. AD011]